MKIAIIGLGGIGAFYGAKLLQKGLDVSFIARGETLQLLQNKPLEVSHPNFTFKEKVDVFSIDKLVNKEFDLLILCTKAISTKQIAKELFELYRNNPPYILSLQNGVENEDFLCEYFPKDKIIGGLTRKIGAHIIKPGVIKAEGIVETIIGPMKESKENKNFIENLNQIIQCEGLSCQIVKDIKLELWKKLIINNGVNAICALLEIKTGELMHNKKLSLLVYGLMSETASAASASNVEIKKEDVDSMFQLIKNFDSIKPSMLVDKEFNRPLEIDEICEVVIRNNKSLGLDSAYTKSIAYLLEFTYNS